MDGSLPSRFVILGTAGHIDHGKTALVGLLTGTDTDRLKEEKARGISIDLGFAHLDLPGGISCGVVDVPGHERFVRNMLAGACGVDAMLLVIAADEGVMPQTREHLDILDLLGVDRGVVALTKTDMVEPEWLDLVTESVTEYLGERGFGSFPVIPVSSKTGAGRDALIAAISESVTNLEHRSSADKPRLPVDRAFVVEGFGSVVTGTLWRGSLKAGDHVVIEPGAVETRIRNLEVHGETVPEAVAGQRTAVALAGVSLTEVPRGRWVLAPKTLVPAHMLDVRVRMLKDAAKELRHRQRVRFHLGASEILGRVFLLEGETLGPGEDGLAQMRLESEAVAERGDRFVIRAYSPARALAGGVVILPNPPKRRKGIPSVLDELHREESGSPGDRLLAAVTVMGSKGTLEQAARETGFTPEEARDALAPLVESGEVLELQSGLLVARSVFQDLTERILSHLEESQKKEPLRWGLGRGELKSRLPGKVPPALFDRLILELQSAERVSQKEDAVRLGGSEHSLSPEIQSQVDWVVQELERGGVKPPSPKELQEKQQGPMGEILEHLTFQGQAVKVTPELYLSRSNTEKLVSWLKTFFQDHDQLSVAELKSTWGISRKYSVPILEYLDREGWTRRSGDVRIPGKRIAGQDPAS